MPLLFQIKIEGSFKLCPNHIIRTYKHSAQSRFDDLINVGTPLSPGNPLLYLSHHTLLVEGEADYLLHTDRGNNLALRKGNSLHIHSQIHHRIRAIEEHCKAYIVKIIVHPGNRKDTISESVGFAFYDSAECLRLVLRQGREFPEIHSFTSLLKELSTGRCSPCRSLPGHHPSASPE